MMFALVIIVHVKIKELIKIIRNGLLICPMKTMDNFIKYHMSEVEEELVKITS